MAGGRLGALTLALSLGLPAGGCSFSYQLDSLFAKAKDEGRIEQTGSLRVATPKPVSFMPPETDLVVARAAVRELLTKGGKDSSVPWENPATGARGTVTPIASAYNQDGTTCHDFLASYVRNGTESWLQGEACRFSGKWEVRHMKPWQRT
jgi:17 kDa outer membrane surface antigen